MSRGPFLTVFSLLPLIHPYDVLFLRNRELKTPIRLPRLLTAAVEYFFYDVSFFLSPALSIKSAMNIKRLSFDTQLSNHK